MTFLSSSLTNKIPDCIIGSHAIDHWQQFRASSHFFLDYVEVERRSQAASNVGGAAAAGSSSCAGGGGGGGSGSGSANANHSSAAGDGGGSGVEGAGGGAGSVPGSTAKSTGGGDVSAAAVNPVALIDVHEKRVPFSNGPGYPVQDTNTLLPSDQSSDRTHCTWSQTDPSHEMRHQWHHRPRTTCATIYLSANTRAV